MELYEVQEWVIALLAFMSCIGLGMRARASWKKDKGKALVFIGDIIPRLAIAIVYTYFSVYYADEIPSLRGIWVRGGLTGLFLSEVAYDLILMWNRISFLWEEDEKQHDKHK